MSSYLIGIDLGTTNCSLSYHLKKGCEGKSTATPSIESFSIPQLVASGTVNESLSLPSFLYFPLQEEIDSKMSAVEWDEERELAVGTYARERGGELPTRLVSSAKSWLCHPDLDRRQKLLPFNPERSEEDPSISPVEACAQYLQHLREAWDHKMEGAPFVEQSIFITVPASFDPSARQLVQEAAETAGYPDVVLLEEPQAAFYAWLDKYHETWRDHLAVGDKILVVDVGGGTTDFSLISVEDEGGDLNLERIAVGSHLLLGGDNMDLALAYTSKAKLEEEGHDIDDWQMQHLVHACRKAKESLLSSDSSDETVDINIPGRGSSLIGGSLSTSLERGEVEALLIDGFIPLVDATERSKDEKQAGLQQLGLPYAQDPRISCQLAKFLSMTGEGDSESMDTFVMPSAVLFNGGTLKGSKLQERVIELLNSWAKSLKVEPVKVLPGADLDQAVSRGAAYYGIAREGNAIRIKAGTSRSYYIGVESSAPAVPGIPTPLTAICVVPFGMEEGTELTLEDKEFALVLGEQATFRFFSHETPTLGDGSEPEMGTLVKKWKKELTELHPIETVLDRGDDPYSQVKVKLTSKVTELGVLELWCIAEDGRKWKLEFDIREGAQEAATV